MEGKNSEGFHLRLFGCWQLSQDNKILSLAGRQQRLISALAIKGPRPRTYFAGLLWPDRPNPNASESVRATLHLVSRQVPNLIVSEGQSLALNRGLSVDLQNLRNQLRDLEKTAQAHKMRAALHAVRQAELLPGWYEDWVLFEQNKLQHDRLRACTAIATKALKEGLDSIALQAAEAALELEPLYESAVRILVTIEAGRGNTAAALQIFEKYRKALRDEMGLRPSDALVEITLEAVSGRRRIQTE